MLPTSVVAPTLSAYDAKAMCVSDDVRMLAPARKQVEVRTVALHKKIVDVRPRRKDEKCCKILIKLLLATISLYSFKKNK